MLKKSHVFTNRLTLDHVLKLKFQTLVKTFFPLNFVFL